MEIIDINWNPKQQNEKKRVKPPKWPKQNHRNKTNLSTKTKRPIWPKNMQKITVNTHPYIYFYSLCPQDLEFLTHKP